MSNVILERISPAEPVEVHPPDLGGVPSERLEAEITTLAAHLTAAMCRWLMLVGEYDRRRAFEQWECLTMAHWLNVHVGISLGTARQHVAVARKLNELTVIRDAFSRGEVSFSRVRAICRVATPADERRWLDLARNATGSQIERIVRDTIRVEHVANNSVEERIAARREVSWWIDDDGMYHVTGVLPPEVGALMVKLIKTHTENTRTDKDRAVEGATIRHDDDGHDDGDGFAQRCVDGFARVLARAAQQQDPESAHGCCDTHDARREGVEVPLAPVLTVIHRYPNGSARLEDGPPITGARADRLGAFGDEIVATHRGEEIRFGRRRKNRLRAPSKPMRRFLTERDRCCQFPGCGQRKNLHAHHVQEFGKDGETISSNLVLLCPRHHGAIHHRAWTLIGNPNDDGVEFRAPNWKHAPDGTDTVGDPDHIVASNEASGVVPGPDTVTPQGRGERYDHELTVWITTNFFGRNRPTPTP